MKMFVTLGQSHVHVINGVTFDRNCVAVLEAASYDEGRAKAFQAFGDKFCTTYSEDAWRSDVMIHFPRGFIKLDVELKKKARPDPMNQVAFLDINWAFARVEVGFTVEKADRSVGIMHDSIEVQFVSLLHDPEDRDNQTSIGEYLNDKAFSEIASELEAEIEKQEQEPREPEEG